VSETEIREVEWYLRDYFFRQHKQGKQKFNRETLARDMIGLYLRYRNADLQKITDMLNSY
jgi:hypothetical protein